MELTDSTEPDFYGMTIDELPVLDEILPQLTLEGLVLYVSRATHQPRPSNEQIQRAVQAPPFAPKQPAKNTSTLPG